MTDMNRCRPSAGQVTASILWVLAAVFLVSGVAAAVGSNVASLDDPATTGADRVMLVVMMMLVWGHALVVTAWPVTVPAVVAGGWGLAYLRQRYRRCREAGATPVVARIARVVLLGYAGVLGLTWLILVSNASCALNCAAAPSVSSNSRRAPPDPSGTAENR